MAKGNQHVRKIEDYLYQQKYGYLVNVSIFGEQMSRTFPFSAYNGSKDKALKAARKTKGELLTTRRVLHGEY